MNTVQEYILFLFMLVAGVVGYLMLKWMEKANPQFNRTTIYAIMTFWISLVVCLGIALVKVG